METVYTKLLETDQDFKATQVSTFYLELTRI